MLFFSINLQIDNETVKIPLMKPTKPLAMADAQDYHLRIEVINIHVMPLVCFLSGFYSWQASLP